MSGHSRKQIAEAFGIEPEVAEAVLNGELPRPELVFPEPSGMGTSVGRTRDWLTGWRQERDRVIAAG